MTQGIVFYLDGDTHLVELTVAIHTLRRRALYAGNIAVVHRTIDRAQLHKVEAMGARLIADDTSEVAAHDAINAIWARKALAHLALYPYDLNLYYDADHLFQSAFDLRIFDMIAKYGFVTSNRLRPADASSAAAMQQVNRLVYSDIPPAWYQPDAGCVGVARHNPTAMQWLCLVLRSLHIDRGEELSLGVCVARAMCRHVGDAWNTSDITAKTQPIHLQLHHSGDLPAWLAAAKEAA